MLFQKMFISVVLILGMSLIIESNSELPKGFVYADEIIPDLDVELRYFSSHNFVGDTIIGYHKNRLITTLATANALKKVQDELQSENLCLLIYDGYRPQRAVNHFIAWAKDLPDTLMKASFYPKVNKRNLFQEGYIASRSGHSRGSTLDLTIIDGNTNEPLDMGSPFDFFGPESWVAHNDLTEAQKVNRKRLQDVMRKYNFISYSKEWWHFTLRQEPFPETYFDFEIR